MDLFNKVHIFEPMKVHTFKPNIRLIRLFRLMLNYAKPPNYSCPYGENVFSVKLYPQFAVPRQISTGV